VRHLALPKELCITQKPGNDSPMQVPGAVGLLHHAQFGCSLQHSRVVDE